VRDLSNAYHFVTRWRVVGTCGEVADVLGDPLALAAWWPSVYLAVEEIRKPDVHGVGQQVALLTKGWLPYTLRWEFEVIDSRYPRGFTIDATGDFAGRGEWTFTQDGPFVDIVYDWRIRAEKPLLKWASPALKPIFAANHRWAMARGEESLRLELVRRRATTEAARRAVAGPPGPVTYAGLVLVAGGAAIAAMAAWLAVRQRDRRA
jgi:hypothetical protein